MEVFENESGSEHPEDMGAVPTDQSSLSVKQDNTQSLEILQFKDLSSVTENFLEFLRSSCTAMATSGQVQPLKIPDAVVALAQAAAKANGETEKYLPGWPLFSPPKMQLHKCTRCSREFCSSIAFRRHTRVHRRTLKIEKDFPKNRDHVAAFWDKLMVDQAQTILSLEDVVIEGISGLSILTALSSWMCKPGYASLPLAYARAGNELLDLIQTTASRLPISSNELFTMLDEASENTFLCTNTTASACIQKFLFDGEVDKVATELKNVVACTSYMLEQKLVEAWSADKAVEALRCQKLLVEEEEAAQKRQAETVERKRMKKLRQKEQRLKDLKDEDVMVQLPEIVDGPTGSHGIHSLEAISDPGLYQQEDPQYLQWQTPMLSDDNGFNGDLCLEDVNCDLGHEIDKGVVLREQAISTRHLDRPENLAQNSFASGSTIASKHPSLVRHSRYRDPNVSAVSNRNKTWAWKVRTDIEERVPTVLLDVDDGHKMVLNENKNSQMLIGSISVAIEDGAKCLEDLQYSKNYPTPDSQFNVVDHPVVKVTQLISQDENGYEVTNDGNITPTSENHSPSSIVTDESGSSCCNAELAEGGDVRGTMFSSKEASAFLSRRWKEAITADHVKLVLCSEN